MTTDFFGFDTSDNHFGLQGLGGLSEMGDAVLGLVGGQMKPTSPRWVAVRNVSDPQIKAEGTSKSRLWWRLQSTKHSVAGARFAARSFAGR